MYVATFAEFFVYIFQNGTFTHTSTSNEYLVRVFCSVHGARLIEASDERSTVARPPPTQFVQL